MEPEEGGSSARFIKAGGKKFRLHSFCSSCSPPCQLYFLEQLWYKLQIQSFRVSSIRSETRGGEVVGRMGPSKAPGALGKSHSGKRKYGIRLLGNVLDMALGSWTAGGEGRAG